MTRPYTPASDITGHDLLSAGLEDFAIRPDGDVHINLGDDRGVVIAPDGAGYSWTVYSNGETCGGDYCRTLTDALAAIAKLGR